MSSRQQIPFGTHPRSRRDVLRLGGRAALALGLSGSFGSLLAACGNGDAGQAAGVSADDIDNATGTVKVLSWPWYEVPAQIPEGLSAEWGYLTANEDTITKTEQAGSFDLVGIYQGQIDQLRALDRIVPIDTSLLANFSGINPLFQETEVIRRDGEVFAIPFIWGYGYLVYDRRQVDEPTSLDDLMAPELQQKVAVPDDPYAVITTFAKLAGFEDDPNRLTPDQFQETMALLEEFRPQLRTIYPYGEAAQMLGRQDIAIAFPEFGPTVVDAREAGADAETTLLAAWSFVDCWMVLAAAGNPAAAYAFMDQTLDPDAQHALAANSLTFPVVDSAVAALPEALQYETPDDILAQAPLLPGPPIDDSEGFVGFPQWVEAWGQYKA